MRAAKATTIMGYIASLCTVSRGGLMTNSNWIQLIMASLGLVTMAVYAVEPNSEPRKANHEFNFDSFSGENQDIEILNYRYGNSDAPFTHPAYWELTKGHISQGGNTNVLVVGDSLWVKWRVNSTGKVYEDTVDLKNRLPSDMDDKIIHFSLKGPQLYVYVIEGNDAAHLHAEGAPDCPASSFEDVKCTRIYPDHWKNF